MPATKNILELRQILAEKFPGLRIFSPDFPLTLRPCWPTGISRLDALLQGGLAKGAVTELVAAKTGSGSALLVQSLLRQTGETNQFVALIDGTDSLDLSPLDPEVLARLLWVRCANAAEALKAADILLRDRNLPLVILDLKLNTARELNQISGSVWHRLQRLLEQSSTAFLVVSPRPLVSRAEFRLALNDRFGLEDLERHPAELMENLAVEIIHQRGASDREQTPPSAATSA